MMTCVLYVPDDQKGTVDADHRNSRDMFGRMSDGCMLQVPVLEMPPRMTLEASAMAQESLQRPQGGNTALRKEVIQW